MEAKTNNVINFLLFLAIAITVVWAFFAAAYHNEYGNDILWSAIFLYCLFGISFKKIWFGFLPGIGSKGRFSVMEGKSAVWSSLVCLLLAAFLAFYVLNWQPHLKIMFVSLPVAILLVAAFAKVAWSFQNMN